VNADFEYFLENMGPVISKRRAPPSSLARFQGKLPDQLLAFWDEHGWCGYADGLFWTVDPQEYESVWKHGLATRRLWKGMRITSSLEVHLGSCIYGGGSEPETP
jgi:hypothetical protein